MTPAEFRRLAELIEADPRAFARMNLNVWVNGRFPGGPVVKVMALDMEGDASRALTGAGFTVTAFEGKALVHGAGEK